MTFRDTEVDALASEFLRVIQVGNILNVLECSMLVDKVSSKACETD
jgi:hypothetical protein